MSDRWSSILTRIRVVLVRRGRTAAEAEDLVQEAWLRMAGQQRQAPVTNPEAFLMRTAINLSIDVHRSQRAQGLAVAVDEVVLADAAPGVEAQLLGRERLARMTVCLERLPERSRGIFLAHRLDGRSYSDIAREMHISAKAVEKHVAKAMLLLVSCMEGW